MVHKTDEWSDEELMARAVCGDVESFAILVQRYEKNLYQHLYQMLDNPAKAADVFQETFLWVRLHMNSYVCGASFQPWLNEIANNLCQERVFKAKRTTSFLRGNLPDDHPPAGLAKRTVFYVERTAAKRKKISIFLRFAKGVAAALTAVLIMGVVTWFAIPFIPGVCEVVRRPECQKNLEQLGVGI